MKTVLLLLSVTAIAPCFAASDISTACRDQRAVVCLIDHAQARLDACAAMAGLKRPDAGSVQGAESPRAAAYLAAIAAHLGIRGGHALTVLSSIPAHAGLGSGTQLALGIAAALRRLHGLPANPGEDARVLGRGHRSGIGIFLFQQGGFVVSVEKTEKIVRESGMFFVARKRPSTHHVSPHISPRSHHKNTTFRTRFLQNTPQKHQQKRKNPTPSPAQDFFRISRTEAKHSEPEPARQEASPPTGSFPS